MFKFRPLKKTQLKDYDLIIYCNRKFVETKNDSPKLKSSCCSLVLDHNWYIFAGFHRNSYHANDLHRLSLKDLSWHQCPTDKKMPSPRDKFAGWTHNKKLYFFGGFGPSFKRLYLDQYGIFDQSDEDVNLIIFLFA